MSKDGFHPDLFFPQLIFLNSKLKLVFFISSSVLETTKPQIDNPNRKPTKGKQEPKGHVTKGIPTILTGRNLKKTTITPKSTVTISTNNSPEKKTTNSAFLICKFLKFYGEEFEKEPIN
jgi:hypothetical protein